jgi:hypothetical protein
MLQHHYYVGTTNQCFRVQTQTRYTHNRDMHAYHMLIVSCEGTEDRDRLTITWTCPHQLCTLLEGTKANIPDARVCSVEEFSKLGGWSTLVFAGTGKHPSGDNLGSP